MIQRIQTLYLLAVSALVAVTLFARMAWFASDAGELGLYAFSLKTVQGEVVQSTVYMGIMLTLSSVLPLFTVFLYRRRLLQIRLCVVELVLLLGSLLMEGIYCYLTWRALSDQAFHMYGIRVVIALPLIGMVLTFLAARAIFHDELMVRAADRIR